MILSPFIKKEIEESILSTIITDNNELFSVELRPDLFTDYRVDIFETIKNLIQSQKQADFVTIAECLSGKIKASQILEIVDAPISINTEHHVKTLEDARIRREMYKAYMKACEMCKEGLDPQEIASSVKANVNNVERFEFSKTSDLISFAIDSLEAQSNGSIEQGIKTGFRRVDEFFNGFLPGEYVVIAARPGMGKTSIAMNWAKNFALDGHPGVVFTMEMPEETLIRRMISDMGSIDGGYTVRGNLKEHHTHIWSRITETAGIIHNLPIYWDDTPAISADMLYSRARKAKILYDIKWIVVDYIQLMKGWNKEGQGPKSEISQTIKTISKDLSVTSFILSQFNREIEKVKRAPQMSDLRDSGSIEQDADTIIFPWIPDFKNGTFTKQDEYKTADLHIAKNRRGPVCKIEMLKWQGHYFRYSDNSNLYS